MQVIIIVTNKSYIKKAVFIKQIFQNFKSGKLELVKIPVPAVKPDFVLVKNHSSLISPGTEKATIEFAKKNIIEKAKFCPDQVKEVINKIKTEGIITILQRVMKKLDNPLTFGLQFFRAN